ncbi:MAG TPA: hypothetical protein VG456_11830 [Candidatus Sulfopaludibacter sp.]|jgi:uncharacterized protein (TIGR03437 family)|nr:hypothetical protein [Candidatus Sulfopaludibacter sp.]
MKTRGLNWFAAMFGILAVCGALRAQTLTVAPAAVTFNYQMGATPLIQQQKTVVTLPTSLAGQTVKVTNVVVSIYQAAGTTLCSLGASNTACGWLSVTPSQGSSPLSLIVTSNPSTLTAGSYTGSFTVSNSGAPAFPTTVTVTLSISNPPAKLAITSKQFPVDSSGNPSQTLGFSLTTDTTTMPTAEIDVSSTGDIIPFTVTAANATTKGSGGSGTTPVWLRVALVSGGSGLSSTSASTSAFPGSYAGITVSLDYVAVQTLDPAGSPYSGTITIAAANSVNGSYTVAVTLNIAAGAPTSVSVFPTSVNALLPGTTATNNYVFTLVGTNFFTTSAVSLQQVDGMGTPIGQIIPLPQPTFLSRQVVQVTINPAYFAVPASGIYPVFWQLKLANPAAASNPSLQAAYFPFVEVDPTQPTISAVVNAASYQSTSVWAGAGADPVLIGGVTQPAVSPREIISIFGQNLGPVTAATAQPQPMPCPNVNDGTTNCSYYTNNWGDVSVAFGYVDPVLGWQNVLAPILMISSNQVNAIVPKELNNAIGELITISVTYGSATTLNPFSAVVVQENPGMFTFGGLGQGQGAVINYDSSGTITSVNSTKNTQPRGNTIAIYATGLGELSDSNPGTGDIISSDVNSVLDATVRVDIGGQPCVVTYAGTAKLTVAGLVQINAVVPPNAKTGTNVPIVVSIGAVGQARSSQSGVTVAVK